MVNYLILLSIVLGLLLIADKRPDLTFWIFITLLFDPTGHFANLLSRSVMGGFNYLDVFFFLSFLPLLSRKVNIGSVFSDKLFQAFMTFFLFFLFYRIFIHGLIVPNKTIGYVFRYQIIRERIAVFGFLLIIPIYVMAKRNVTYLIYFIIFATVIPLTLYYLTILTGLDLVPVGRMDRYRGIGGSGVIRVFMTSTGLSLFIIPIALCVFLLQLNIKYKGWIFAGFILTSVSIILTLGKGMFLYLLGVTLISLWLLNKWYLHTNLIKFTARLIIPIFFAYFVLTLTFPQYVSHSLRLVDDISALVLDGGLYSEGRIEGRIKNQLPAHLYTINKYPIFGTGLGRLYEQKEFRVSDYDVTDLSVTGHIAQFGIIGISIYLIFYYLILILLKRVYSRIKKNSNWILKNHLDYFLVSVIAISYLLNVFIFRFDKLFSELSVGRNLIPIILMVGILLAVLSKLNQAHSPLLNPKKSDNGEEE
jgi:hypothetical protein